MPCWASSFLAMAPAATRQTRLAGAGPAAAAVVATAVLGVEREIGVARAILVLDVAVIAGCAGRCCERAMPIGGAVGHALEDAGPDLGHVLFLALA